MDQLQKHAKAQARERVAAARATAPDMTWKQFRNVICALRFIESDTLVAAGIIPDTIDAWHVFQQRPTDFFLTLPDDLAEKLFTLAKGST